MAYIFCPDGVVKGEADAPASLRSRAHALIPGGAHTYAKGDDQFPASAPGFITHGKGCHVWGIDGREYIEYGMGLRAVGLGHAYPSVIAAAARELGRGSNFTRPSPLEVECAESFQGIVPSADMVKFTKDGSTATSAAIRLARAFTGRDTIALCSDHPFFSYDDWAIGKTSMDAGIPTNTKSLTQTFKYNDLASAERLFASRPNRIAALILEPEKNQPPAPGFLAGLRDLCTRNGALLIFDEMITGFRWPTCSAQRHFGVTPDLSTFGKALGNGFAISALAGKREIMMLGGRNHGARRVFLLSTTHGAETHALAAAIAVMKIYRDEPVIEELERLGDRLKTGVQSAAARHGLGSHFKLEGRSSNMVYLSLDANGAASQPFRTLFMQEIARAGILAPSLVTSYSHTNDDIDRTIDAVDRALAVYRKALENGIDHYLEGPSVRPVFTRNGDGVSEAVLAPIIHTDAKSRRPRTRLVTRRGAQLRSLPI
jgi:glutamate-1-semialdehyde 2,1-aminomutase